MKIILLVLQMLMSLNVSGADSLNLRTRLICDLPNYVKVFNELQPENKLFVEDLAKAALATDSPLVKIDKDEVIGAMAADAARCMVRTSGLESTLKQAYSLYFNDPEARRALWTFFLELDSKYLTEDQRVSEVQRRDSLAVNLADGAYYGSWIASAFIWYASRGRSIPMAMGTRTPTVTGLAQSSKIYDRAARSFRLSQWFGNAKQFTVVAGLSSSIIGSPVYIARQLGLITTQDQTAVTRAEQTYHRMHWLELDCRARHLRQEVEQHQYNVELGIKDPLVLADTRQMNHLISDLNFLVDVSQLYYSEVTWPSEFKVTATSVEYQDLKISCPAGFSQTDPTKVRIGDVRAAVAAAATPFLGKYANLMLKPVESDIAAFYQKNGQIIAKAVSETKVPQIANFFAKVNKEGASVQSLKMEKFLEIISAYLGVKRRIENRKAFLENWIEFKKSLPKPVTNEMDGLARKMVGLLPSTLFNQIVLQQLFKPELYPANQVFVFNLGMVLEGAFAQNVIKNKDAYIIPDELQFYLHGSFEEVK